MTTKFSSTEGKESFSVSVIGLGRIGLPHSLVSAQKGNSVFGIDSNAEILSSLKNSRSSFTEEGISELLLENLGARFFVADNFSQVKESQIIIVAIGINYVNGEKKANLTPLIDLCDKIAPYLGSDEKLLVFRTTMPVGTTDLLRARLEERTELKEGRDFHIVFCPERLIEGRAIHEETTLPKIIGAYTDRGFEIAKKYFETIGGEMIRVSNPKAAELTKLVDNSWRQLSFAFSNDLALLCEHLDLDVLEVVQSANMGYKRNSIPPPSCGVSGYCLTKDPYLLETSFEQIARKRGFNSVWYYGRQSNDYITEQTYQKVLELYRRYKIDFSKPIKILVAGLSFKEDTDDFRFSHGIDLLKMLSQHEEFNVSFFDPFLSKDSSQSTSPYLSVLTEPRTFEGNSGQVSSMLSTPRNFMDSIREQDIVVFTVKHREFLELAQNGGAKEMVERMRKPAIVVDGWNIFANSEQLPPKNEAAGCFVVYSGIGRKIVATLG